MWFSLLSTGVKTAAAIYKNKKAGVGRYGKGDYCKSHSHYPSLFSFVYFIKCPPKSSPLIFTTSGEEISAEEGKVVIFPSMLKHHVPYNHSEDRIILSGNMIPVRQV